MASIVSAAAGVPGVKEAPSGLAPQPDAASAICRIFAPESVYDASFDGGALASALADAAVDVTVRPAAGEGPFSLVTALHAPAESRDVLELLVPELASRSDVVLITLDWGGSVPLARVAAAWLTGFEAAGLHFDPLAVDETVFPYGILFRRDAAPLSPRLMRAFARILAERHAASADRVALAEIRALHDSEAERAARLELENRALRVRLDSAEQDNRSLTDALHDVNTVLEHELDAVRTAEKAVEDDIAALNGSGLWQLKLKLARKRNGGSAS